MHIDFTGIKQRLLSKPPLLVAIPTVYFLVLIFLKWKFALPIDALWFFLGAVIGIFLLDFAEEFSHVEPSPFRTIIFGAGLLIVGFYIVSSTSETIAKGLILSLSLTLFLFQYGEWKVKKNLVSWYVMLFGMVPETTQKIGLVAFALIVFFESLLFLV
jgi:hypothetical protein